MREGSTCMLDLDRPSLTCFDSSDDRRVVYLPFFKRRTDIVSVLSALVELLLLIVHSHILLLSPPGSPWTVLLEEVALVLPAESWLGGDDLESFCVSSNCSATFGSMSSFLWVDGVVVLEGGSGRRLDVLVLVLGLGHVDRWETLLVVLSLIAEQGSCAISTLSSSSLILAVKY